MKKTRKGVTTDAIIMGVATVAAFAAVSWILRHPDAGRTANMRVCLAVRRVAQRTADSAQKLADDAGTQYNALRLTT